jgi:hypothetical protein
MRKQQQRYITIGIAVILLIIAGLFVFNNLNKISVREETEPPNKVTIVSKELPSLFKPNIKKYENVYENSILGINYLSGDKEPVFSNSSNDLYKFTSYLPINNQKSVTLTYFIDCNSRDSDYQDDDYYDNMLKKIQADELGIELPNHTSYTHSNKSFNTAETTSYDDYASIYQKEIMLYNGMDSTEEYSELIYITNINGYTVGLSYIYPEEASESANRVIAENIASTKTVSISLNKAATYFDFYIPIKYFNIIEGNNTVIGRTPDTYVGKPGSLFNGVSLEIVNKKNDQGKEFDLIKKYDRPEISKNVYAKYDRTGNYIYIPNKDNTQYLKIKTPMMSIPNILYLVNLQS